MSEIKPFKAHFEYSFNDEIKNLFREGLIETFLNRIAKTNDLVNVSEFLTTYLTGSNIPIFKEGRKIPFDYHLRHSISPETISKKNPNSIISFKVNSEQIEVIQIIRDDITFVDKNGIVNTVTLDSSIILVRA